MHAIVQKCVDSVDSRVVSALVAVLVIVAVCWLTGLSARVEVGTGGVSVGVVRSAK